MTTVIRLDTNAAEALFPEGSTQRVEITKAVASNIVNKHLKEEIRSRVQIELLGNDRNNAEFIKDAVKEYFIDNATLGSRTQILQPKHREELVKLVGNTIKTVIYDEINAQIEEFNLNGLSKALEAAALNENVIANKCIASVNRNIDKSIEEAVRDKIKSLSITL